MMIRVITNTLETKANEIKFPVIAIGRKSLAIVAFTSSNTGVVLSNGLTGLIEFKEYKNFISVYNPDWKILSTEESIELRNTK